MEYKIIKLNTARNSLRYIIKTYKIKEIYIPYYICYAIRNAVNKENCSIIYYHIDKNFIPIKEFPNDAYILYPNYFGICSGIIDEMLKKYSNLIIDNAHSFYSEPRGLASFNSLRKFFPTLRDGSFLYLTKNTEIQIEKDAFKYLSKYFNYDELCRNENRLDFEDIKYTSDSTMRIFERINFEEEKERRIKNFNYWNDKLGENRKLQKLEVPFSYPYYAKSKEKAEELVKKLEKENIIVLRYWNNLPDSYREKCLYTNIVSIPL